MRRIILLAMLAFPLTAQQPQVQNGTLTVERQTGLQAELQKLQAGGETTWLAYTVPTSTNVDNNSSEITYLEGEHYDRGDANRETGAPTYRALILVRVADHTVGNVRVASPNRKLDAGGTRVVYLASVDPVQSVAMLQALAEHSAGNHLRDGAVFALSTTQSPATVPALARLAAPGQDFALREKAAFWLSTQHGAEALPILDRFAHDDKDDRFREKLTFDLTLVHPRGAADTLIRMAHQDPAPQVRKQAQFWMAHLASQIGGERIANDLQYTAAHDPNEAIRKSAVFSLTQLANGEGTTRLIDLAQSSKDPAVRKEAVFWLGQSSDPRALEYLTRLIQQ